MGPHFVKNLTSMIQNKAAVRGCFKLAQQTIKICIWLYVAKSTLGAILLVVYSRYKTQDEDGRELYRLIATLGCSGRNLGLAGILWHSIYIYILTLNNLARHIWRNRLEAFESMGTILFMKNFDQECEQLRARIRGCVEAVRVSNFHYKSLLARHGPSLGYGDGFNFIGGLVKSPKQMLRKLADLGSSKADISRQLEDLGYQDRHLSALMRDQSPVWPVTRCERIKKIMTGLWFYTYFFGGCLYSLLSSAATVIALAYATEAMRSEPQPEFRRPTTMEQVDIVFQHFYLRQYMNMLIEPSCFMVVGFLDQIFVLLSIKNRFVRFNRRLDGLNELYHSKGSEVPASEWTCGSKSKLFRKFKQNCDAEAVEIYISIKVFVQGVRNYLQQAEYAILLSCSSVLATMSIMIAYISQISMVAFQVWSIVITCLVLNAIMFTSAYMNKECMNTVQLGWSLLAKATAFCSGDTGRVSEEAGHIISPHIVSLWRRLIMDDSSLTNSLSSKLFGVAHLNFGAILTFNFWIVSVIGLFMSAH